MNTTRETAASLEALIESVDLGVETLHPGGLDTSKELAELCRVGAGLRVLDVASGTGLTACFLAETYACQVVGVDASDRMLERARKKLDLRRGLPVEFRHGDAGHLPFDPASFDVVISECTLCILDKEAAIREMVRVARPGGYVGMHDLCWKEGAPDGLKDRLAEIEGERPETLDGWKRLFENAGLRDTVARDRSDLIPAWTREFKRRLGVGGQLWALFKVWQRWGLRGLQRIRESEGIFRSEHLGYGLVAGRKP